MIPKTVDLQQIDELLESAQDYFDAAIEEAQDEAVFLGNLNTAYNQETSLPGKLAARAIRIVYDNALLIPE